MCNENRLGVIRAGPPYFVVTERIVNLTPKFVFDILIYLGISKESWPNPDQFLLAGLSEVSYKS